MFGNLFECISELGMCTWFFKARAAVGSTVEGPDPNGNGFRAWAARHDKTTVK